MVPAGSSSTECARRHSARRHRGTLRQAFSTVRDLLRNRISMGNFIPIVCTPSVGTIQRPSPAGSEECFRRPVRRAVLVLATDARVASTAPFTELTTRTDCIEFYIGRLGVKLAAPPQSNVYAVENDPEA